MESLQNTRKHRENPENYTEIAVKYINTINTSETKLTCKYTTENKMTKKKKKTSITPSTNMKMKDQFGVLKEQKIFTKYIH